LAALDPALDFKSRKNEAKRLGFGREVIGRIVVIALDFRKLDEEAGFFFGLGDGGFALGLEGAQFGRVLFDGAGGFAARRS